MNLFEHVATTIRDLRQAYNSGEGLSQQALAKALDVAPNTVSRWETATYRPTLEDLDRLGRFFSVSILRFFPSNESENNEKVTALLRTAKQLPDSDIDELQRYAEFRKARHMYENRERPRPGRKRKA